MSRKVARLFIVSLHQFTSISPGGSTYNTNYDCYFVNALTDPVSIPYTEKEKETYYRRAVGNIRN